MSRRSMLPAVAGDGRIAVAFLCACALLAPSPRAAAGSASTSDAAAPVATTAPAARAAPPRPGDLGEVVVTAGLREVPSLATPASVAVLDARTLAQAGVQHVEEVLGLVPNLNWSAGSARPRYFQLRGIGELEQYQGAPNPSVGFLIDDIDFGGLGTVATLYDLERVEVLRGPQGTRYGANALGGLIYARSRAPGERFGAELEAGGGDYGAHSLAAMVTGPLPALDSALRLAVQRYRSDGYSHDAFLGRDTNARDETTARLRWQYRPSDTLAVDLSVLHARIDDGYDAFAIDNSRTTQSDRPGEDSQHATGESVRATWTGLPAATLTLIGTHAQSRSIHAYDGDWGNAQLWAPYTYDFTYRADRRRTTRSLDVRLASTGDAGAGDTGSGWLVGVYAQQLEEKISELSAGTYDDPIAEFGFSTADGLASRFRARSFALYGQLDGRFAPALAWSLGLRAERRTTRYADEVSSFGLATDTHAFAPGDDLGGGHASLTWTLAPRRSAYLLLARGYKAGGFNLAGQLPAERRGFDPESLWNAELGYKAESADGRLRLEAAAFYMRRTDLQVRIGEQLVVGDPNTFVLYTVNAPRGYNAGVEGSARLRASGSLELGASLGVLRTRYRGLVLDGAPVPDRAQPHAPGWQAALDATWHGPRGIYARADLTGTGAFYFDVPPNDTRSRAYALVHLRAGWEGERWSGSAYVRNLFDRRYATRGFYFGNEPPDFQNRLYTQLGAPREVGVQLALRY